MPVKKSYEDIQALLLAELLTRGLKNNPEILPTLLLERLSLLSQKPLFITNAMKQAQSNHAFLASMQEHTNRDRNNLALIAPLCGLQRDQQIPKTNNQNP